MKKLSNTETELKKTFAYKKPVENHWICNDYFVTTVKLNWMVMRRFTN